MFFYLISFTGIFYLIFKLIRGKDYICPKCLHSIRNHHKLSFKGCSYVRERFVKDWQSNDKKYGKVYENCYCQMTKEEIKNRYLLDKNVC
jgi:hypothetical protein